jgi:uncharacterized membrane protein
MDATSFTQFLLRWFHILSGITWIGMLYFFNLVNVNFMKALDAPTKGKVIPELMPRALFWFRWGAVSTWLTGFIYFVWIVMSEQAARLQQPISGALNKGIVVGVIVGALVAIVSVALVMAAGAGFASNRSISIGIGGGIGTLMLLNVWGIIWPHQKRLIAWTKESAANGTPMPPEAAKMARRAFLASRMNTWLSLPMLWFMAMAYHLPLFSAAN